MTVKSREVFGVLCLLLISACGTQPGRGAGVVKPIVCTTTRCHQIVQSIGRTDDLFFPIFMGRIETAPDPSVAFETYVAANPDSMVFLPKETDLNPKVARILRSTGEGIAGNQKDMRLLSKELDEPALTKSAAALRERMAIDISLPNHKIRAAWIGGSSVLPGLLANQAPEPTDEWELLKQFLSPVDFPGESTGDQEIFGIDKLLLVDPDVIFYTNVRGEAGIPEKTSEDANWAKLSAVQNHRVFVMPASDGNGLGPLDYGTFLDAVESLKR
jgi:hypothetical protein